MKARLHLTALLIAVLTVVFPVAGSGAASAKNRLVSSRVGGTALTSGLTLSGSVVWTATTSEPAVKVEFLIDGALKWTESIPPYQYNGDPDGVLDTRTLSSGTHTLKVQAYLSDGRVASTSAKVKVANASPITSPFTTTSSIGGGATLTGTVTWTASPSGGTASKVQFLVDGALASTDQIAPYQLTLDTTTLSNGTHTLTAKAYATDGATATISSSVTVSNEAAPSPLTMTSSVADGATLTGSIVWTASPSGGTISRVDFLVDSVVKSTDVTSPYQYNGDGGQLDTTQLASGAHTLTVRAYATDGRTATKSSSVTVSNVPPPTLHGSIPRFGVSSGYKILQRSPADQAFELDQIKAVGGKIVRTCSTPGNQSLVDQLVSAVLARGMEPLLVLWCSTGPISPSTAASFAGSQAAKWKGRVRLYEFANEPDLNGWNGTTYAQALIPVYDAIKAADANAVVLAGALWKGAGGPVQFVTDMYNAGAKGHFDILSLHLYDDPLAIGSWNIWNMAFHATPSVRSVMDAHGDTAIPIASTETGGPTTTYGEDGQATIIGHDFDALSDPRLAFILVYSMMDDVVTSQPGFGLLRPDLSKRPAWDVCRTRAAVLT